MTSPGYSSPGPRGRADSPACLDFGARDIHQLEATVAADADVRGGEHAANPGAVTFAIWAAGAVMTCVSVPISAAVPLFVFGWAIKWGHDSDGVVLLLALLFASAPALAPFATWRLTRLLVRARLRRLVARLRRDRPILEAGLSGSTSPVAIPFGGMSTDEPP